MFKCTIAYITTKDSEEAQKLANIAINAKLAACANITPSIESIFNWQGQLNSEKESLLILKTQTKHIKDLTNLIKNHHSYDTPCIIFLPIIDGNEDFLNWIENETTC